MWHPVSHQKSYRWHAAFWFLSIGSQRTERSRPLAQPVAKPPQEKSESGRSTPELLWSPAEGLPQQDPGPHTSENLRERPTSPLPKTPRHDPIVELLSLPRPADTPVSFVGPVTGTSEDLCLPTLNSPIPHSVLCVFILYTSLIELRCTM